MCLLNFVNSVISSQKSKFKNQLAGQKLEKKKKVDVKMYGRCTSQDKKTSSKIKITKSNENKQPAINNSLNVYSTVINPEAFKFSDNSREIFSKDVSENFILFKNKYNYSTNIKHFVNIGILQNFFVISIIRLGLSSFR